MNPKGLIKAGITILMLLIVAYSISFEKLVSTIREISLLTALIVILGYTVGQLMSSVKWWTIARSGGIDVSYPTALKAYMIGMFVNCFGSGLGTVGGDVARGILISHGLPKKTEGIAAVVADRIHGLTVLSIIALITSQLFHSDRVPGWLLLALLTLITGFILAWIIGPWLLTLVPSNNKLSTKLKQVAAIFPRDLRTLTIITAISIVFHCLQIMLHSVMASAVNAQIPLATLFVVIPLVNIASSLPISWNGLGVRENSYMYFLTAAPALVSSEQAAAFGALWLLAVTATSAIGGIVALVSGDLKLLKRPPATVSPSQAAFVE
ncbi:MAG: YbhN family protein [Pseudomonadota bacterium]|jgi:uncharacterized membrane protein YbhN (UPF0104 family)